MEVTLDGNLYHLFLIPSLQEGSRWQEQMSHLTMSHFQVTASLCFKLTSTLSHFTWYSLRNGLTKQDTLWPDTLCMGNATCMHTHACTRGPTHTCTIAPAHMGTRARAHAHTLTPTHIHMHMHTRAVYTNQFKSVYKITNHKSVHIHV